jgi:YggT family protein
MQYPVSLLLNALYMIYQIWTVMLFIWAILSWIPQISRDHPAVQFLNRFIEPVVLPFRRLLPMPGGLDLSPLIAYFVVSSLYQLLDRLLRTAFF